jgi:hypothetical protein
MCGGCRRVCSGVVKGVGKSGREMKRVGKRERDKVGALATTRLSLSVCLSLARSLARSLSLSLALSLLHMTSKYQIVVKNELVRVEVVKEVSSIQVIKEVEVEKEIIKEVPVEKIVYVEMLVTKEVPVPVEVIREVLVPVEKIVERLVEKEVEAREKTTMSKPQVVKITEQVVRNVAQNI